MSGVPEDSPLEIGRTMNVEIIRDTLDAIHSQLPDHELIKKVSEDIEEIREELSSISNGETCENYSDELRSIGMTLEAISFSISDRHEGVIENALGQIREEIGAMATSLRNILTFVMIIAGILSGMVILKSDLFGF